MKRLLITPILVILISTLSYSQIVFQHEFTGFSASIATLTESGMKYYVMDDINNQCRIYNPDFTLWKTINLSVPSGYYLVDIQYVSDKLFNNDNAVELLYVVYTYDTALGYGTYATYVAGESGNLLLTVSGGGYSLIYSTDEGPKLLVWVYDYSVSLYTTGTRVYSLPDNGLGINQITASQQEAKVFPNPAQEYIMIPLQGIPSGSRISMKITDGSGKKAEERSFRAQGNLLRVETRHLPAGTYFYQILSEGEPLSVQSGKFILQR